MYRGKRVFSITLIITFILGLVACGGDHVAVPNETGDYTVNYHDSVALPSINAEIEFTDFSVENPTDAGTGDLNFYITLHLSDETDPAVYITWFSNFSIGTNTADYELVTMANDGTGEYTQIPEDNHASLDAIIYHAFCTTNLSGDGYSLTCSVNDDLNFEFDISADEVNGILFDQAEELFGDEQYGNSLAYYKLITGSQKEQADMRIQSIECLNVIDSLNATIEGNYTTTNDFWGQYMDSLFNTSITAEGSYDVTSYTYNLRIYFSSMFSDIAGIFGASLGDVVGNSGGIEGTQAQETYEVFREAGFDGITCRVEHCDYEGNVIQTDVYTKENYEQEHEAQIQSEDEQITSTFTPGTVSEVSEGKTTAWHVGERIGEFVKETILEWEGNLNYSCMPLIITGEEMYADFDDGFAEGYGVAGYTILNALDPSTDFDLYTSATDVYKYIFLFNPGNDQTFYDMLHTVLESMETTESQYHYTLFETNLQEMLCISLHELEAIGRDQFTAKDATSGLGYF